ncbi:MAG: peptidylprolyl isomerase [Planctomycetota bacterium]|jgi:parvulin-like peptidyl-prolyl isomerase
MSMRSVQCVCWLTVVLVAPVLAGCTRRERVAPPTIGNAWEARVNADPKVGPADEGGRTTRGDERGHAIATVNGQPIARHRLVDLLLRSHGVNLLEQLIALEAAQELAGEKGLHVGAADVDREYDRALRRLLDPLFSLTSDTFDRQQAERLLDTILADRNMSREEFLIVIRRNAYLRAVVESQQVLTDRQLRTEYERAFGERVQVRHIQLATPAEVSRITDRLDAGGDFGELARDYSANAAGARLGGLLEPFAAHDDDVPELLREVAFSLEPGGVSSAVRIGSWYHLLRLEQRIPAEDRDLAQVRGELERRARERLAGPAMEQLYERLFREASIQIHEPVLRDAFEKKHPDLGGKPKP